MRNQTKRSRYTQKRIDYIAYGNPSGVRKVIYGQGYDPPRNIHELVDATQELVRKKGRKVLKELIKAHPDRRLILKLENPKEDNFCSACNSYFYNGEDNFCGVCGFSHYNQEGNNKDFLARLIGMGSKELEIYYQNLQEKAGNEPADTNLAKEIELAWSELRNRKQTENSEDKQPENNGGFKYASEAVFTGIGLGDWYSDNNNLFQFNC